MDINKSINRQRNEKSNTAKRAKEEAGEPDAKEEEADFTGFSDDDEPLADDGFGRGAGITLAPRTYPARQLQVPLERPALSRRRCLALLFGGFVGLSNGLLVSAGVSPNSQAESQEARGLRGSQAGRERQSI